MDTQLGLFKTNSVCAASQPLGERIRAAGGAGIVYDSIRHAGGSNVFACRPRNILNVAQADHWRVTVEAGAPSVGMARLSVW
jgi:hypothetical protein